MQQIEHVRGRDAAETRHLQVLLEYEILDSPPEIAFDRITALAAHLLDVPMALVTLVDGDRVWFKSRVGVEAVQVARDPALCTSAILRDEPWVIEDAWEDPRAHENPLVAAGLGVRFHAGAPLTVREGVTLGTLCVMDRVPRQLDASDLDLLGELAQVVTGELEQRRQRRATLQLLRDVARTARRERERARTEAGIARELTELDASRTTYLRAVSHDLQTPLICIRGMAELLADRSEQLDEEGRTNLVTQLAQSTEALHQLVTGLLDTERTRRPEGAIRREHSDVVAIADAVASQPHLADAPVLLPTGHLEVDVDPVLLERILDNLIGNAWLHAPTASTIEVEFEEGTSGGLLLMVSDDGPGIAEAERTRVLEAFARAGGDRAVPGAGLGLSLVAQFAAMHGGSITVGERPGGGARFTVDLPGGAPS